ncbi:hypothetical protein [Poseidonocella sedimentorum]|uniref:Uncharacterized protein n=1 Tax=Poseidonocella sedimentorum TaxID=871652 RepID=A0A1I6D3Q5_9RHOB|nr:hypothetical protein [Poseidonocella sedimentorum]SFR00128.1 hypothetical protein SAMN04515673_10294 [Poseidonocella sedimentorum]
MIHRLFRLALCAALMLGSAATATTTEKVYELLFREGTLNALPDQSALLYERAVSNARTPETAERDTGRIALRIVEGEPAEARLRFEQDGKYRNLGSFPKSVGNPMIMYFVETVVRDMAESAGGSPFYIRNRVKASLVEPGEMDETTVMVDGAAAPATVVTLRPFAGDPNAERMQGFGALELKVTMSEAVPGWYHSLVADVPGEGGVRIYHSEMSYLGQEGAP